MWHLELSFLNVLSICVTYFYSQAKNNVVQFKKLKFSTVGKYIIFKIGKLDLQKIN